MFGVTKQNVSKHLLSAFIALKTSVTALPGTFRYLHINMISSLYLHIFAALCTPVSYFNTAKVLYVVLYSRKCVKNVKY